MDVDHYLPESALSDADRYRFALGRLQIVRAFLIGRPIRIDGVECIVTSIEPDGITTRPVTDAD